MIFSSSNSRHQLGIIINGEDAEWLVALLFKKTKLPLIWLFWDHKKWILSCQHVQYWKFNIVRFFSGSASWSMDTISNWVLSGINGDNFKLSSPPPQESCPSWCSSFSTTRSTRRWKNLSNGCNQRQGCFTKYLYSQLYSHLHRWKQINLILFRKANYCCPMVVGNVWV